MNGQEFYEKYLQKIEGAKTSVELSNIQKELLDVFMKSCEDGQYSELNSYVGLLLSAFNDKKVNTVTKEVRAGRGR